MPTTYVNETTFYISRALHDKKFGDDHKEQPEALNSSVGVGSHAARDVTKQLHRLTTMGDLPSLAS